MVRVKPCICLLFISTFLLVPPVFSQEEELKEVKELRDDIQIINLLNNLSLRPVQMEFILRKAKEAKGIRNSALEKVNSYKTEIANTCSVIKEEVESGKVIVDQPNAEKFRRLKEEIERFTHEAYDDVDRIAVSVEKSLEEFQLLALDSYKPCVIPIIKNGRIGQVGSHQGIIRILERVRSIPAEQYWSMKGDFARKIIEKTELKLPPDIKFDEAQAQGKIFSVFEKVRAMEEVDFSLQKETLAEELQAGILPEKSGMERYDKIKKFLLSENIIPILEKKISESKNTE